jgi:hypothetical protein
VAFPRAHRIQPGFVSAVGKRGVVFRAALPVFCAVSAITCTRLVFNTELLSGTRAKGAWYVIAATPHERAYAGKRNLSCVGALVGA